MTEILQNVMYKLVFFKERNIFKNTFFNINIIIYNLVNKLS